MTRWGSAVLGRLSLEGHDTVLDAGCGSGRVTEQPPERIPDSTINYVRLNITAPLGRAAA